MPTLRPADSGANPAPETVAASADPAVAWTPFTDERPGQWNLRLAAHLWRRAGFGGSWEQLQQTLADGPQRAVEKLLHPEADLPRFNRDQDRWEAATDSVDNLRGWWLRRILQTPQPLLEKLTLFWHGHFGISAARATNPALVTRHVQALRSQALGRFDLLLEGLLQDQAVLLGLDAAANRKAAPSEHAARVWLECYTVGPGQFAPSDVRDLSRALTGWFVLRGEPRFFEREFDDGEKLLLGRRGKFNGPQAVKVLLEHPATPRFVVRRLYRSLVSETAEPPDALLAPLAAAFAQDYDIAKLVGTILRSKHFFSAAAYRRRIKSPVEFAVGLVRSLDGGMIETVRLGQDLAALGQNLYHPPTVYGWAGGEAWLNPAAVLGRQHLSLALLSETGPYANKVDPAAAAAKHAAASPEARAQFLMDVCLQGDLPEAVRDALAAEGPKSPPANGPEVQRWLRQFTHRLTTLPEYQLA